MNREKQNSLQGGFLQFLWRNKIWWIAPAVSVLILTALLLYLGSEEASSPFVYTLF